MKAKKSILSLGGVFILSVMVMSAGCGAQKTTATVEEKYIPVEVQATSVQTLVEMSDFSGKVFAEQEISVVPKLSSKVTEVKVRVGAQVKAGEVLFTLDLQDLQKAVDQASIGVRTAETNYQRTKEQLDQAKLNLGRQQQIYAAGAISKDQLEGFESQASEKPLEMAQIQWEQSKLSLQQAQDTLSNALVTAPIGGTVSAVNVKYGEMTSNTQPAVTLTTLDNLYVLINVAENIINTLKPEQEARIVVSSAEGVEITGKVYSIAPTSDARTQLYPVKVTLENKGGLIKPGMFAKVQLATQTKANILAVNSESVLLKNGKNTVYIVEGDRAVAKEVLIGLDTGSKLEILKGLNAGEKVIVKGQTLVNQGSKVKVVGGSAS
ncbi:MAG: efflux RND transporter periplasmic adaptor subunit [Desulfitobacteriaceae bacterium]